MVKKIVALTLAVLCGGYAYSQDVTRDATMEFSGELKTGVYWDQMRYDGGEWDYGQGARMHHDDDAGNGEGRFRLNMLLERGNIGMKIRFEQLSWAATEPNRWSFAYAFGNFFGNQLKITAGKLGDSPWGAGGPEIWNELDNQIGIRTEIKLNFIPGLNFGFVVNKENNNGYGEKPDLWGFLQESVIGAAYTHEYFHVHAAYRFDGDYDVYNLQEGTELIYRLEERYLKNIVEGLRIWVNGFWLGIGAEDPTRVDYKNWMYIHYTPAAFTAELRIGMDHAYLREMFHARPAFYYNFFPFLSAGASFYYVQDFGEGKVAPGSPYSLIKVEPKLMFTLAPNALVAFVYSYGNEYYRDASNNTNPIKETHKFNLRVEYTF